MTIKTFTLKDGVTTRRANMVIRNAIAKACREYRTWDETAHPTPDYKRSRSRTATDKSNRHVFGMHTGLRDTLVATHEGGTRTVDIVFPANYQGWDRSDFYTRMRVRAYDLILHQSHMFDPMAGMIEHD